jgi:hypothetical protein
MTSTSLHGPTAFIMREGTGGRRSVMVAVAFCLFLVLAPSAARAAEGGRTVLDAIDLQRGATCLDADTLADRVRAWLESDTVEPGLTIEVRGSLESPRIVEFWTLRAGRPVAYRRFGPGPERCDHLHEALGLAIAMAVRASLVDEVAAQLAEAKTHEPPGTGAPATLPWSAALDAMGTLHVLPGGSFGISGRIERALTPSFGVRLGVVGLAAPGETFDGISGHFDAWIVAAQLDLCAALELSPHVRARACMGIMGGMVAVQGHAFSRPEQSVGRWFAAANGVGLVIDLGERWALDLMAGVILPLERTAIVVQSSKTGAVVGQRELAPAGEFLAVGPIYRF